EFVGVVAAHGARESRGGGVVKLRMIAAPRSMSEPRSCRHAHLRVLVRSSESGALKTAAPRPMRRPRGANMTEAAGSATAARPEPAVARVRFGKKDAAKGWNLRLYCAPRRGDPWHSPRAARRPSARAGCAHAVRDDIFPHLTRY